MQIFIIPPSGIKIVIEVESGDTIRRVKDKINDKINFPSYQQRLIYGKQLQDDWTSIGCLLKVILEFLFSQIVFEHVKKLIIY